MSLKQDFETLMNDKGLKKNKVDFHRGIYATTDNRNPISTLNFSNQKQIEYEYVGCIGYNGKVAPKYLAEDVIQNIITSRDNLKDAIYRSMSDKRTAISLKNKINNIAGIELSEISSTQIAGEGKMTCYEIEDIKERVKQRKKEIKDKKAIINSFLSN